MANTGKHTGTQRGRAIDGQPASPLLGEPTEPLSPRVEALRKLMAAGQYRVSPRYLALRIFRAAGVPTP